MQFRLYSFSYLYKYNFPFLSQINASTGNKFIVIIDEWDVLTLLIHLGYLAYNQKNQIAYIPNEEIRGEFMDAVEDSHYWSIQEIFY